MGVIYAAARLQQTDRPVEHDHRHDHVLDFSETLAQYRAEAIRRGLIEGEVDADD
jgi:hypothetical protein